MKHQITLALTETGVLLTDGKQAFNISREEIECLYLTNNGNYKCKQRYEKAFSPPYSRILKHGFGREFFSITVFLQHLES